MRDQGMSEKAIKKALQNSKNCTSSFKGLTRHQVDQLANSKIKNMPHVGKYTPKYHILRAH